MLPNHWSASSGGKASSHEFIEDVPYLWRAQVPCTREGQTGIPPSYHSYLT